MTDNQAQETTKSADEWLTAFAAQLGTDAPDSENIRTLLELAGAAAHASERVAAPIACYMLGRTGHSAAEGLRMAEALDG